MTTKRCRSCDRVKSLSRFEIVGADLDTGDLIRGDRCCDCVEGGEGSKPDEEDSSEVLAEHLAAAAQMDLKILESYTPRMFQQRLRHHRSVEEDRFSKIKETAAKIIGRETGLFYQAELAEGPGNYIVIGESHGIYTIPGLISCIRHMAKDLNAKIIHVGHLVDRHKNISSSVLSLPNLTVIPVADEMHYVRQHQASSPTFRVVRERVLINGVLIRNQHYRGDYTHTSSATLRLNEHGHDYVITNRHLHETHSLCKNGRRTIFMTTGCMCERHKARKPRRLSPDGQDIIQCSLDATYEGRRQDEINKFWENGLVVVSADKSGATAIGCRARQVNGKWCVGYGNRIYTEGGPAKPDEVVLVVGDVHVSRHDPRAISIVDQVAEVVRPDCLVDVGDHWDWRPFNHHLMERGEYVDTKLASECGKGSFILSEMGKWAKERHIVIGNHGRFVKDFASKWPQFESLLNFHVLSGAKASGFEITDQKGVLVRGKAKFHHGDLKMFGSSGDRHLKMKETMEADTMFGHTHCPSCRCGCYAVGLLGLMDQEYNETEASAWIHGFGMASFYGGEVFMNTIPIIGYSLRFLGRVFTPKRAKKWMPPEFVAKVTYEPVAKQGKGGSHGE